MADEAVLTEAEDGVLLITLNRPDQRNAVNAAIANGIGAALDRLDADAELRVGVLTGAGKGFSAGMDLKAFVAGESTVVERPRLRRLLQRPAAQAADRGRRGLRGGRRLRGRARLRPDRRLARREARHPRGQAPRLVAAGGALLRLPRRLPYHVAMEMTLTGEPITAERAAEHGLVNRLTEPGEAVAGARELAAKIAVNGPLALAASKRILVEAPGWPAAELWQRQAEITDPVFGSQDAREGATAFAEKRDPVWRGL